MEHAYYMQRCIQLARNGLGTSSPNPLVGSIIVHNGKIIGEGWHHKAGEPHAEVMAIRSVETDELLRASTLYVNLEPCAHYGRTPPCSDLIIEKQIARVVIGSGDPFEEVNGKGVAKMRKAGIEVIENILPEESRNLNKRFFTFHRQKRPYIILKWAQSRDGFLDKERKNLETGPNWITGKEAKILVHQWRAQEDAILVGAQTALNDNPSLTVREVKGENPVRLLIDPELKVPNNHKLFNGDASTLIFNFSKSGSSGPADYIKLLENLPVIPQILEHCYTHNLTSILVEGGSFTLQKFISLNIWDEARIWTGTTFFKQGLKAPTVSGSPVTDSCLGPDHLQIIYNR